MTFIIFTRRLFVIPCLIFASFLIFNTCSEDSNPVKSESPKILSDKLTVGEETKELTQDIGPGGGSIIISNTESVLNGMEIIIPSEGYSNSRTYSISSSKIIDHKLGKYVNPVSPLISIKNGGGYSDMPIKIKVSIHKEPDEFLIGFLFNEVTGELEALPVVELEDSYIIVETRHFALSSIKSDLSLKKTSNAEAIGNLIISSIKESVLSGQTVISSGFTPGIDDWEFPNWGSYIASGGHCAGQSVTAMWYFYEKKLKGAPSLYHQFDSFCNSEKPNFIWQDNPFGYRLASTVQEDAVWGRLFNLQSNIPDLLVWKCFIFEMLRTGNPQFVGIINTVPGVGGGHALIAYKVNVTEGKIYVADPNYPNNRSINGINSVRIINYSNNMFQPYPSYANVGDPGIEYDQIRYYSTSTIFDWSKIGERYREFEDKTIGNDRFPQYVLYFKKGTDNDLFNDGLTVYEDTLKLFCKNENIPGFIPGTDRLQHIWIFDSNGTYYNKSDANGIVKVLLNPGENKFGISIYGYINTQKPNKFVDFKWVNVNLNKEPTELVLDVNRITVMIKLGAHFQDSDGIVTTGNFKYQNIEEYARKGTYENKIFAASWSETLWDGGTATGSIGLTFDTASTQGHLKITDYLIKHKEVRPWDTSGTYTIEKVFSASNKNIYGYTNDLATVIEIFGSDVCINRDVVKWDIIYPSSYLKLTDTFCNNESYFRIQLTKEE